MDQIVRLCFKAEQRNNRNRKRNQVQYKITLENVSRSEGKAAVKLRSWLGPTKVDSSGALQVDSCSKLAALAFLVKHDLSHCLVIRLPITDLSSHSFTEHSTSVSPTYEEALGINYKKKKWLHLIWSQKKMPIVPHTIFSLILKLSFLR